MIRLKRIAVGSANTAHVRRPLLVAMALFLIATSAEADQFAVDLDSVLPTVRATYSYLHENPELGKAETKAHDFLLERLEAIGGFAFVKIESLPTAIVAVMDTGQAGPVIALRSELDARQLNPGQVEPSEHQPRSLLDGFMHNCGHDVHTAILLGTAELVARHRDRFLGKIVFIFQPAEEVAGGADDIVKDGILDQLKVEAVFALHSAPGLAVGSIAIAPGSVLAGSSYFTLNLTGKSSHAAAPFEGSDIPMLAAELAQSLSYLPARKVDIANRPMVISVTRLKAESSASNSLPSDAEIGGTIRAFEDPFIAADGAQSINAMITDLTARFAAANNIAAKWSLRPGAPPTRNDEGLFQRIVPKLQNAWPGTVTTTAWRGMFSEDFAYYTAKRPSLYFSLGIAKDGLGQAGVHTVDFTTHPDSFVEGVRLMSLAARIATTGEATWN
ncbi:MAG: amidohydrolase [Mesorhizobium sp.]|nr:MAG: amidohydrolase [Mesorhizobium sp.]